MGAGALSWRGVGWGVWVEGRAGRAAGVCEGWGGVGARVCGWGRGEGRAWVGGYPHVHTCVCVCLSALV